MVKQWAQPPKIKIDCYLDVFNRALSHKLFLLFHDYRFALGILWQSFEIQLLAKDFIKFEIELCIFMIKAFIRIYRAPSYKISPIKIDHWEGVSIIGREDYVINVYIHSDY